MEREIAHTGRKPHTVVTRTYINACINVCGAAGVGMRVCTRAGERMKLCGSGRTVPAVPCVTMWNSRGKKEGGEKKTQAAKTETTNASFPQSALFL